MFKNKKVTFKSLKRLHIRQRLAVARDPNIGPSILGALTPTQYAELFPKYYQRGLPDVGGFQLALTRKSQEKQDAVNRGVENLAENSVNSDNPEVRNWSNNFLNEKLDSQSRELTGAGRMGKRYEAPANASEMQKSIIREANKLGISPTDLATMMHYESAGSMSPSRWGGKGGNYMGLIQFGPDERKQFGVYEGQSFDEQMGSVGRFLEFRGLKRWMDSHPNATDQEKRYALYSTINAGRPEEKYWHKGDRPGYSVIRHVDEMFNSAHHSYGVNLMSGTKEVAVSGEQTASLNKDQATKWDSITPRNASSRGQCGQGVRNLAAQVFGDNYFNKGLAEGGSAQASSLTRDNQYLIKSGYYNRGNSMSAAAITKEFYDSLPPGAIVAFSGGNKNGDGHVQMKVGGRWVSDYAQKGFWARSPEQYGQATIYYPNQEGQKVMSQRGLMDTPPQQTASVTAPARIQSVSAAPVSSEKEEPKLDPQTGERQTKTEQPVTQQAVPSTSTVPAQPKGDNSTQQPPVVQQTSTKVEKPKIETPTDYNVNRDSLISAIKQTAEYKKKTAGIPDFLISDDAIYNGFLNDNRTQQILKETNSSFDQSTGNLKIGNYEKFKSSWGDMDTSKFLKPVPSHAGGGKEKITGSIDVMPIRPIRGDNALVTDSAGKQFTMNTDKETATVNPQSSMVNINHRSDLGHASAFYESGGKGVDAISTGKRDRGGVSYGAHQLASKTGTMKEYLNSPEGAAYKDRFGNAKPGSKAFNSIYSQIANEDPHGFAKSQHSFITRTHYEPIRAKAEAHGYNVNDPRVQEALYSMSVQHRNATNRVLSHPSALATVGQDPLAQVNALYDVRQSKWKRFSDRYQNERKDIASMDMSKYGDRPSQPETTSATKPFGERINNAVNEVIGVPKAEASPIPKSPKGPMGPTPDTTSSEIGALRQQVNSMQSATKAPDTSKHAFRADVVPDNPNMIGNITEAAKTPFQNPSFYRAMTRTRFQETGDGTNDNHFSTGNKI